jgi:hypothetical protein
MEPERGPGAYADSFARCTAIRLTAPDMGTAKLPSHFRMASKRAAELPVLALPCSARWLKRATEPGEAVSLDAPRSQVPATIVPAHSFSAVYNQAVWCMRKHKVP